MVPGSLPQESLPQDHHDHCGSDFEPLMDKEHRATLSVERHQVIAMVDYAYFD